MRYFTLTASGFGFLSVKGWFWPPGVLIYREDRVRTRAPATKKRPASASRFSILWWAVRGSGPLRGRPLRRLRASRAALANADAFPQLRALSGSNPCTGNKKAAGIHQSLFYSMVGRQGFEPWTLGLKAEYRLILELSSATLHPL